MIVDDLNVFGGVAYPTEANSVLIVDANAVLSRTITDKLFQAASGQSGEIVQ